MNIWQKLKTLILTGMLTFIAVQSVAADQLIAENVADGYLRALTVGDIENALSFLDESFLGERKALMDNPAYAVQLRNAYTGADYEILGSQLSDNGNVLVNTKITLPNNDDISVQFVLRPTNLGGYRITAEK